MNTLAEKILKLRWLIIIGFILISLLAGMQIRKAEIEPDMKKSLPDDMASRLATDKIDEMFGGTEMLMILLETEDVLNTETLKRTKKLSKELNRIKGVDKVMSLFDLKYIRSEDGAMLVDPAVRRIPKTEEKREILREEIRKNDIVYGSVISKDFTLTAVIAVLKSDVSESKLVPQVEELVHEIPGSEKTIIGGLPYIRAPSDAHWYHYHAALSLCLFPAATWCIASLSGCNSFNSVQYGADPVFGVEDSNHHDYPSDFSHCRGQRLRNSYDCQISGRQCSRE